LYVLGSIDGSLRCLRIFKLLFACVKNLNVKSGHSINVMFVYFTFYISSLLSSIFQSLPSIVVFKPSFSLSVLIPTFLTVVKEVDDYSWRENHLKFGSIMLMNLFKLS